MRARIALLLTLALAASPAAALDLVLTGTIRKAAESGEVVIGYRTSSVPFSFEERGARSATRSTCAGRSSRISAGRPAAMSASASSR